MRSEKLFGGRATACDFADLYGRGGSYSAPAFQAQNRLGTHPEAHQRHNLVFCSPPFATGLVGTAFVNVARCVSAEHLLTKQLLKWFVEALKCYESGSSRSTARTGAASPPTTFSGSAINS